MNKVITILLIAGACWGVWALRNFYLEKQAQDPNMNYGNDKPATPAFVPQSLPGMQYQLEIPLQKATEGGAASLKKFLDQYRSIIKDPRLGWIELDYVTMQGMKDPAEARALFAEVKKRTPTNSPIYFRIEKLAKVYE